MKTLLRLTFLSIALQNLWFGVDPCTNVDASGCESDRRALTTKLMELHNSSIKHAIRNGGGRPLHFAEPCPGYCTENNVGSWCSPNCRCHVLADVKPPIYMCFENGKALPMGFKDF
uniref:Secreted protein n=1 Tax=Rhipicephalus appendiculatus TaxID=34631 RepID=A0A131YEP7_RHIAP